jgi:IclR family KDG regulon transcriptional repressor
MANNAAKGASMRPVGTAVHVCRIFDCFSARRRALNLTEISASLGLAKSSVHRLLRTLVAQEYLAFDPRTRRYRLGERVGGLAEVYGRQTSLATIARPFVERLRDATRETAGLQVRDGDERYCVVEAQSPQSIRMTVGENVRYALGRGSSGHVLRAFSADWAQARDHLALRRIRAAGYAISRGEVIPGAIAIYVPVLTEQETADAALGVYGPAFRNDAASVRKILAELKATARELALALRDR